MSDRSADVFKALAEEHRRRILSALCSGPMVAGELGRLVGLAPNAVSFHLKWLRSAGLVSVRREGRFLRYHAQREALAQWQAQARSLFEAGPAAESSASASRTPPAVVSQAEIRPKKPKQLANAMPPTDDSDEKLPTELL